MRDIEFTTQFKRDMKRIEKRGWKRSELNAVLELLVHERSLPLTLRDHPLTGNWKGARDLHVRPDWVLIYRIKGKRLILERTGSHSDIFKK